MFTCAHARVPVFMSASFFKKDRPSKNFSEDFVVYALGDVNEGNEW